MMKIDWTVIATIAAPIIALFVGAWLNRWLEGRSVLTTFYGHVAAFTVTPPGGVSTGVNTHAVVIRNTSAGGHHHQRLSVVVACCCERVG